MMIGSLNIKAIYVDDPLYSMFVFQFSDVVLKFEDDKGISVWFDCSPQYISDSPLTLTDEDVEKLKNAGQELLHEFISHIWMLTELGIGTDSILDQITDGTVDIDQLLSYNTTNTEGDKE